jgi:hypothetical protein
LGTFDAATFGGPEDGFTFTKPEGWNHYDWELSKAASPLAMGLTTAPRYHFFNRQQDILVTIYLTDPPPRSITAIFGNSELSDFEKQITHELPRGGNPGEEYEFGGLNFTDSIHAGRLSDARGLEVTFSKARFRDKLFYMVITRDLSTKTTAEDSAAALNDFFQDLKFLEPPTN